MSDMIDPGTAVRVDPKGEVGVIRDYVVCDHEAKYLIQLLSGRHVEIEPHRVRLLNEVRHCNDNKD